MAEPDDLISLETGYLMIGGMKSHEMTMTSLETSTVPGTLAVEGVEDMTACLREFEAARLFLM